MRRHRLAGLLAGALVVSATLPSAAVDIDPASIEIPFTRYVLDNGLTLIVHEDHKAPIVAVNVWYHVGSKNEKPGRTGFAHLFEHLMFNGSENFDDDYFKVLQRIGATDLNGTTNNDRTNYFQNVPTSALDTVLWMESDRMGHMVGAIDQAKLDEQRGVVQNEKRQGDNEPYGTVFDTIVENVYPKGHPYSWSVIGSMEDLDAASLDDVKAWFQAYYGAANAVLVVAGDVEPDDVRQRVEKFFGDVPPGPPVTRQTSWIAKMTGSRRQVLEDRVPQARVYKVWNVPEWRSQDHDSLEMVSSVLSSGKTSRLYKRLVYDDQIATDVAAFVWSGEIGSRFVIQASARPGEPIGPVERALDEEVARLLGSGPTADEVERVRVEWLSDFLRGIERIGGFGGKSDVLALNAVFAGSPDHYKTRLQRFASATPDSLHAAARRWLSDGLYTLEVHPYAEREAAATGADRSHVPEAGEMPVARFPEFERTTLSNGLEVVLAHRAAVPVVEMRLLVDAGYASDQLASPGTASLAGDMLDEGTRTRSALEINDELARLGAQLDTGSNLDLTVVSLSALQARLDESLELFADVVLNPSFPAEELERLRRQQIAAIQQEKVSPFSMALRVLPGLVYGPGHAYGNPLTGSGTEESVRGISRDDLVRFHETWFKPSNATLVVVGDTSLASLAPRLETLFAAWKPGAVPAKNLADVSLPDSARVYLLDRPGAVQSVLIAGHVAPPKANPREAAIETMNRILGGNFIARLNMNLREDKHWSYGASSFVVDARGPRLFLAYAPVQSDKTSEALAEMRRELVGIRGAVPITEEELTRAKESLTLTLPGRWETNDAVIADLSRLVRFDLDDGYFDAYTGAIRSLRLDDVSQAAQIVRPDAIAWVVVGDRRKIEAGVAALGLGPIQAIDADGRVVK